ncbi:hypothetical protein HPB50_008622 [Hyalomma asiaticum]|uniref:Uncharacterized protein n=1 Tax=Hyalomma asiaticum TaxID=266040 RepID=A0ACB7RZ80_HYAAI|nr:hypothetical protein HPB50_008622 [Hyalomma asiaticum]
MDVFHGVCVAVFHVDHDDSSAACDGIHRFPRLQAIREVQTEPAVLCIAGDLLSDMDHYPTEHCTHLVYRDMVFFSEHKWFMPKEDEQSFKQFKDLRTKTALPLLVGVSAEHLSDFYVRLWRNPPKMGHFARSAIEWLNTQGFDWHRAARPGGQGDRHRQALLPHRQGASASALTLDRRRISPQSYSKAYRLHDEFAKVKRKLLIVVGLSVTDHEKTAEDVAEHLEDIARYSDYLILETHRIKRQGQCKLALPSSFLEDGTLTSSVPIVERAVTLYPRLCVAAFYLEYEDSMGLCRPKFARLSEIAQTLKRGEHS